MPLVSIIASLANGLGPLSVIGNISGGVKLNELRFGPLFKHGSGSNVIDGKGNVNEAELDRLIGFGSEKVGKNGEKEQGLDMKEIIKFMDENFARAETTRKSYHRRMMNAEWPVLLKVMGKDAANGKRYLSAAEVRTLVVDRTLPKRMTDRLDLSE